MKYELPDFDTLMQLHKSDAKALDQVRKEASEAMISGTNRLVQRRLRGLQFQIDMELRRSKSDLDGCIRISQMMHDSLDLLRGHLKQAFGEEFRNDESAARQSAKILPFSTCS
ncbi:MAG: hypothetical protein ACI9FB_003810 [Candidatus Azotimanducaceae bacterium]|jgi:hypothetical protein